MKHMLSYFRPEHAVNMCTDDECKQLIDIATALGYRYDHPTTLKEPTGIDSCEWFVNDNIHDTIYKRVKQYLPQSMGSGNSSNNNNVVHSINKRWRCFRYAQNCVYRPHIDGSWPESRLTKGDNEQQDSTTYKYDTDQSGTTRSYLTFLIYLNDNFTGGETRYYYNDASSSTASTTTTTTKMVARGVTPKRGCVMVFPQGNTAALLHEGSAVTSGTKYVIRTDVLYSATTTAKK